MAQIFIDIYILSRLFSYLYSCNVLAGLRPRCFGRAVSFSLLCIAHLLIPYSRLNARWLSPPRIRCTTCSLSSIGYFFIPFLPDVAIPPYVVIILHKGAFCLLSSFTGSVQTPVAFFRLFHARMTVTTRRSAPQRPGITARWSTATETTKSDSITI